MTLPDLQTRLPDELAAQVDAMTLAEARKVVALAHRGLQLPAHAPAGVRQSSFEKVRASFSLPRIEVLGRASSQLDPFVKYTLRGAQGSAFEAVRIPLERPGRYSVCISSQVGCALACAFCATGRLGLTRNLAAWELVEQVRVVRDELPVGSRVHGVVFQGMGEPLANFANVLRACLVLSEPSAFAIDAKCITVCTSGLPEGIRSLARSLPNVRLAWSIGSARPEVRRVLMPINRVHPFATVLEAAGEHACITGNAPLWAYTVLAGVNDTQADAHALAEAFLGFVARFGVRPRLTLIPYNPIGAASEDPYRRATTTEEDAFWAALAAHGVRAKRRYSGGADIGAACGQLAAAMGQAAASVMHGGHVAT